MRHLSYTRYIIRHKWFVFLECCKLGIPIAGIFHDLSKLLPDEWLAYSDYFYGGKNNLSDFEYAWMRHINRNPHHWEYWVRIEEACQEPHDSVKIARENCQSSSSHSPLRKTDEKNIALDAAIISPNTVSHTKQAEQTTTKKSMLHTDQPIQKKSEITTNSETPMTEKDIVIDNAKIALDRRGSLSNTMAETHHDVPVQDVQNISSSSCASITSMEEDKRTEKLSAEEVSKPIDGSSETTSLQDSGSSAEIATQPYQNMESVLTVNNVRVRVYDMPLRYRKEMLADWRGTGRSLGMPDTRAWYEKNKAVMVMHPETRRWIEENI